MAANLQSRGFASFGRRFFKQIWISSFRDPARVSSPLASDFTSGCGRRGVHSAYDKNPEDQVHPTVVPDDVIEPQSDKYWAPHPKTGVFGPAPTDCSGDTATEPKSGATGDNSPTTANGGSVLEQKAWFRPLEDVDKPVPNNY
eukprot:TRINITY_DN430_c0_g1_i1.p1 TRINITY_DN430_c0_g1~~TRINITY_DN430_c0_g1_i1.p1  ORF type:complete len:143 (+),score=13.77 TRINITY_DN430_c0_g1_i1:215-643(+)